MGKPKCHVLVVTYPAQGHINPLLQFAKRLASKGLKATLVTTPYTITSIQPSPNVGIEPISDGFDQSGFSQASTVEAYIQSFKTNGSKTLTDLILKFEAMGFPVSCIVYDSLLTWVLDVATQLGVYSAVFLTNSASVCSMYWHIEKGTLDFPVKKEAFPVSLPGLPPLGSSDLPSFLACPTHHSAYLDAIFEKFRCLDKIDWVFCNSFDNLEIELAEAMKGLWPVVMVGPMVPSAYLDQQIDGDLAYGASLWETASDQCLKWLDTKPSKSVIYVSFGSMANISAKQVEEMTWGLKASNRPFLWIIKESQNKLPIDFLSSVGETGLVVSWCNQLQVLAHQSIGCFVSHCGWNSTLEALSLGVPMVCLTQSSDQPTNAKFVEEVWKVGVRGKKDEEGILAGEELEKCISEVMVGERSQEIKTNANKWIDAAKKAVSVGGSSDTNINEFVSRLLMEKNT